MKAIALQTLKTRFEGVSETILSRIAERIAKTATTEEEAKAQAEEITTQALLESYGDSRATEASKTTALKWQKKQQDETNAKSEQTTATQTQQTAQTDDNTPAWAKALIEQNKRLTERLDTMEGERRSTTRRERIAGLTVQLPQSIQKAYGRIEVNSLSDEDFATLEEEIKTDVTGILQSVGQKSGVFGTPPATIGGGTPQKTASEKEQKELLDSIV